MRFPPCGRLAPVVLLVLGLTGCGSKVNEEQTYQTEAGDKKYLFITAPRFDQAVTAVATSEGAPIDLYLLLGGTQFGADEAIQKKTNVLDSKTKTVDPTVQGTVPAGKEFTVVVVNNGPKKAAVKLKVTGK